MHSMHRSIYKQHPPTPPPYPQGLELSTPPSPPPPRRRPPPLSKIRRSALCQKHGVVVYVTVVYVTVYVTVVYCTVVYVTVVYCTVV